jgi:lactate permease
VLCALLATWLQSRSSPPSGGRWGVQPHPDRRRLRADFHRAHGAHLHQLRRQRGGSRQHAGDHRQFCRRAGGEFFPALSATIGALGAFIAGSNTVSNMMFSQFQFEVAQTLGVSTAAMLALQAVGAAAGNMIAIHNVVAASATVGLLGREGATLRKTALPTLYYLLVTGLIGLALMYSFHISDALLQLK